MVSVPNVHYVFFSEDEDERRLGFGTLLRMNIWPTESRVEGSCCTSDERAAFLGGNLVFREVVPDGENAKFGRKGASREAA